MKSRLIQILAVSLAIGAVFTGKATAWGGGGHRTVCRIAFLLLDAPQQAEVTRLIRLYKTPDGKNFTDFADACVFPDEARANAENDPKGWGRFSQFDKWHFLNLPRTAVAVSAADCANDCVLTGIEYHTTALREAKSDQDRAEALLFLGHWSGDIHQPLHVSYADDLGGNSIKPIAGALYLSKNLHAVWDSGIILQDIKTADHWPALAARLKEGITPVQRANWVLSTPLDWAEESYLITTLPRVQYCSWKDTQGIVACAGDNHKRTLTSAYQQEFQDDVETRLQQAGTRLADLIRKNLTHQ